MAFKKLRIICIILMLISSIFTNISITESEATSDRYTRTSPVTLYVGSNTTFQSIQDAIDASSPGDTVFVYNGTYTESLTIGKQINLIGESVENTIIYGTNNTKNVINITANGVKISDLSINYSNIDLEIHGIYLFRAQECIIDNNLITIYFGTSIFLFESNNNIVLRNNITNSSYGVELFDSHENNFTRNNLSLIRETGVYSEGSDNNSFKNNSIYDPYYGFLLQESNSNIISENNITDCYWHSVMSYFSNNNIIENNNLSGIRVGLDFYGSNRNTILNNTIQPLHPLDSTFYLSLSSDNVMKNNTFINTSISISGETLEQWISNEIDASNTFNDGPLYFWKNKNSGNLPSNASNIILANCTNIKIENLNFIKNRNRIYLGFSSNIEIINNSFSESSIIKLGFSSNVKIINNSFKESEIALENSDNNSILDCTTSGGSRINIRSSDNNLIENINDMDKSSSISLIESNHNELINIIDSQIGIYNSFQNIIFNNTPRSINLKNSHKNIIIGNVFNHNGEGINLIKSNENLIEMNLITNQNQNGIDISGSSNNTITKNTIAFNNVRGIYLHHRDEKSSDDIYPSENNLIYHNNFIFNNDNRYQAIDYCTNIWDNGYPSGGNFWSDYDGKDEYSGPSQDQTGSDGIGDSNYRTYSNKNYGDNYPLMEIFYNGFDLPKSQPSAPININLETGYGYVKLTWSKPLYDGGSPIFQYHIYRYFLYYMNGTTYGKPEEFSVPGHVHEFIDTSVENNQGYRYYICAENEMGESPNSSINDLKYLDPDKSHDDNNPFVFPANAWLQCRLPIIIIFIIIIILIGAMIMRKKLKSKTSLEKTESLKGKKKNRS